MALAAISVSVIIIAIVFMVLYTISVYDYSRNGFKRLWIVLAVEIIVAIMLAQLAIRYECGRYKRSYSNLV